MSENQQPTLLVTGASGNLGRRVIELLLDANVGNIIATTRTPEKLADLSAKGVVVRHADFDDPGTLGAAFAGVDRLLLVSTDTMDVPGHRIEQHQNAVKAAEAAGVSHVVYTSLMNPGLDSPVFLAPDHRATEAALSASKMGWTVLRENLYAENLIGSIGQAIPTGQLFSAAGDGKAAYITREDCARAAAAALASSFTGKQTLDITGPESLSQYEVAAIASQITGQTITYIPLELEILIQGMVGAGVPRPMAEAFSTFDVAIAQGKLDGVTTVVEELTGRKPISVADFLEQHRAALTQGAAAH